MSRKAWGTSIQNREEMFGLKRQAVLRSAAKLFRMHGYSQVSPAEIADDLQIAKPTVYYYFRNKAEILREIFDIATKQLLDPTECYEDDPNAPGLNGAQRLERFLRRCIRGICTDAGSCLLTTPREVLDEETRTIFHARTRVVDDWGREILHQGIEDGSLRPCNVQATYLIIAGSFRFTAALHFEQGIAVQTIADSMVNTMMHGLVAARADS